MMTIIENLNESASALALIFITATITFALLKGWNGWLALKRLELEHAPSASSEPGLDASAMTARIEIANLKERLRKLEAIAAGIDI